MANKSILDARYRSAIDGLRRARTEAGLTQFGLAKTIERSQQFVSKYESFERRLDVIEYVQIARVLNADWKALLDEIG